MRYLFKVLSGAGEYVLLYNVHVKNLGILEKAWKKYGITDWEKGDALDEPDEYQYRLFGPRKALVDFYRSAFGEEPPAGELKKA